ncbi:hypothetical protein HYFRA_00008631 [Hymenoscyphus fraxineus]|uniref:Uncharacterized protein n=1 Tax=Hymenoscyphus fraxineus TaxID=746836 RepID=A0A9N9L0R3_9HELO|nr:hypothetical protein HYFRA_00008631 [Hymenoscyphus fraxineus]
MKWLQSKGRRLGLLFPQNPNRSVLKKQPPVTGLGDHHKFDGATGQIYSESTAAIQTSDDSNWTRQTELVVGPEYRNSGDAHSFVSTTDHNELDLGAYHHHLDGLKNTRIRGAKGARSLQDSAIECILHNISDVTYEGISCLPLSLVRQLWHAVSKRCLVSFDTWLMFSKLLRKQDGATLSLHRYRQAIEKPLSSLHVYTTPLTSTSFEFITSLSITSSVDLPNLVKISKIVNLGVLEIINDTTKDLLLPVSDRLLRAWHMSTLNDGTFRVLRIMRLWNHKELTNKSLAFINSFPVLAIYDVRGCPFEGTKIDTKNLGWRSNVEPNVLDLLEAACVERTMIMRESMGVESKPVRRASARQLRDDATTKKMPRAETQAFLTREETCVRGSPIADYDKMQRKVNSVIKREKAVIGHDMVWMFLDNSIHSKTRALETWEFTTYTSFARIGELRNDTDLARSGVDIGDDAILVGNDFIPPVPLVSLRLGPIPLELQVNKNLHKPFYTSVYSEEFDEPTFKYDPKEKHDTPSSRTLSFIRIKLPPPVQKKLKVTSSEKSPSVVSANAVPIASDTASTSSLPSPAKRRRTSIMKNKKKNLGDMLNSFR